MTEEQKPLEVLVADDEPLMRGLLVRIIGGIAGVNVTTAANGLEAIEKYDERLSTETPYDIVITDLKMPRKSGVDVVRHVKTKSPGTPVYIITGEEPNREYRALRAQLEELSPDGVIGKPFDINSIRGIVEQVRSQKYGLRNSPTYQPPTPQS